MPKAEEIAKTYTAEKIWQNFDRLPDNIQDLLLSPKIIRIIEDIAKNNEMGNKTNEILRYTDLILAGIVPITILRETLQEELGIREELARKIATEIRDKIFMKVSDSLRKIHKLE